MTLQPISSATTRASSAAGKSAVPAARMPTRPFFSVAGPVFMTTVLATGLCSRVQPSGSSAERKSSSCSGETRVMITLPVACRWAREISRRSFLSLPSASMASGMPTRSARQMSSLATWPTGR
ncbi:MAG TPA: hypothetical protein PKI26_08405 [Methanothrix sp.]|nr:hypothetical protein [Methanothrix sp.]